MKFDLDEVLRDRKPRSLEEDVKVYLDLPCLKHYKVLDKKNIEKLVPGKTYIKYVRFEKVTSDEEYENHVSAGGFLVKGGRRAHEFQQLDDKKQWTHILLRQHGIFEGEEYQDRIFTINLATVYVFFYVFSDKREFYKNLQIYIEEETRKNRHKDIREVRSKDTQKYCRKDVPEERNKYTSKVRHKKRH